jgi:hypothetical protein
MTIKDLIDTAHKMYDTEADNAYYDTIRSVAWYAESKGVTATADRYTQHLAEQQQRADTCRYRHMAATVLGNPSTGYIYMPGYGELAEIGSWDVPSQEVAHA